jgi:hypothetical protein
MLEGGIADKVGNEFEMLWTVVQVLRVLRGQAREIRIEPFNEAANGLEFRVSTGAVDEWHQCKRQQTGGNWTIRGLSTLGVLQAFAGKLSQTNSECVLISSDPAPAFEKLIEKAHLAELAEDFYGEGGVGKSDREALDQLSGGWPQNSTDIFQWLKRCRVEVSSSDSLIRRIEDISELLFTTDASLVTDRLRSYILRNLARRLTTDILREEITSLSIEWRAHLDPTTNAKLTSATKAYLDTLASPIPTTPRADAQSEALATELLSSAARLTILSGQAGSGKSLALSRIIAAAKKHEWTILAFRVDRHLGSATLQELGQEVLEIPNSPIASLGNLDAQKPSLLVIDQVDAISDTSGRSSRMRDLFFKMLEQATLFPQMRVVVACRTYDLEGDSRLNRLSKSDDAKTIQLPKFEWDSVKDLLEASGISIGKLSDKSRSILMSPINLKLYIQLAKSGEPVHGELTSARLFDSLLDLRSRELLRFEQSWTPDAALWSIAKHMSQNQELTAPLTALAAFPAAIDRLASFDLITTVGSKIQFSHESYFDHIFSRHFVASDQSLLELLKSDEQRLFRRTQVRQILSRLRDLETRKYMNDLRDVLFDSSIRFLIKDATAYWLSEVGDPRNAELSLALEVHSSSAPLCKLANTIFHGHGWQIPLINSGAFASWIASSSPTQSFAWSILRRASESAPSEVARYLREQSSQNDLISASSIKSWFDEYSPNANNPDMEDYYKELVLAMPSSEVNEKFSENIDYGRWAHDTPGLGSRVLATWITKWMSVFPGRHPFADDFGSNDGYWFDEMAKSDPASFLNALSIPLKSALDLEDSLTADRKLPSRTIRAPHDEYSQELLHAIARATERLAITSPTTLTPILSHLGSNGELEVYLRLRAIAQNGPSLWNLMDSTLIASEYALTSGGSGEGWMPFAQAAAAASPYISAKTQQEIEIRISSHRPEYDLACQYLTYRKDDDAWMSPSAFSKELIALLNSSGRTELRALEALGKANLTHRSKERLSELNRKFEREATSPPRDYRIGRVKPVIKVEQAIHMSTVQWENAARKYSRSEERGNPDPWHASTDFPSALQACAKGDPQRFSQMLCDLDPSIDICYAEAILNGLRDGDANADAAIIVNAIHGAMRWHANRLNRAICWLVQKHPSSAMDQRVLQLVMHSAEFGDASDTIVTSIGAAKRPRTTARDLMHFDDPVIASGINGERGAAYCAIAAALWQDDVLRPELVSLLVRQSSQEPLASVLTCMTRTIFAVARHDQVLAISLLETLSKRNISALRCQGASEMLHWMAHRHSDSVSAISALLIASHDEADRAFGYYIESLLALIDKSGDDSYLTGFATSKVRRQMAALRGAANLPSHEYGDRARAWFLTASNDPEIVVRQEVASAPWNKILQLRDPKRHAILNEFVESIAFLESPGQVIRSIESHVSSVPSIAFRAVTRVVNETPQASSRSSLHRLDRVLVELYRSLIDDPQREKEILDLFDKYLIENPSGLREQLHRYERH